MTMKARLLFALLAAWALSAGGAQTAPAQLTSTTVQGQPYDLAKVRGKVVLVFLWSTSCAMCLDKMPELRRNYQDWHDKGFELVAINTDRTRGDLDAYLDVARRTVPSTQQFVQIWRKAPGHRDSFGSVPPNMPTSFLVGRDGKVVKTSRGRLEPALWTVIAELMQK
jgi:thiol-disulfide isomerase/thioredoxin